MLGEDSTHLSSSVGLFSSRLRALMLITLGKLVEAERLCHRLARLSS